MMNWYKRRRFSKRKQTYDPVFCKPVFLEKAFDSFSQQIYKQYYEKKVHLLFAKKTKYLPGIILSSSRAVKHAINIPFPSNKIARSKWHWLDVVRIGYRKLTQSYYLEQWSEYISSIIP
jgi:hypothetical protein